MFPFYSILFYSILGGARAWSFSVLLLPVEHYKRDSQITRSKISYNLMKPQPLPCTPACGHEFHAFSFHPHPTFTAPRFGSTFRIPPEVCGGACFVESVNVLRLRPWRVIMKSSVVDAWQLCLRRRFPPLGLHKAIFNSFFFLILLIHTNTKTVRRTPPLGR